MTENPREKIKLPGKLIVFEGIDRFGNKIAIHLLFSANRWEMMYVLLPLCIFLLRKEIVTTLEAGTHILLDRYCFSGVAYSVGAENLKYNWCIAADEGIVSPDLVIYLDNPTSSSARRSNFGEERYEDISKLERVRSVYEKFYDLPYWHNFDATLPIEELSDMIYDVAISVIKSDARRLSDTDLRMPYAPGEEDVGYGHLLPPFV
ncbi:hypothetical protein BgAZ_105530 [Babesia gibsoni]|uniref:dTMP kinase n=1 Tax=Babesia gibsoni TaxID=33632 RepID=A0AAD8PFY5_BABGI|nr:hypothetical protein BgAZ_105530 [Babesia gibsoni]